MKTPAQISTQEKYRAYAAELPSFSGSECSCKTCRGLCSMVPCFGTPQEVKAIIDSGRKHILARRWHLGSVAHGLPPLDCVMVRAVEIGQGCSQFDGEKCLLHDTGLKPSEGKFANHDESTSSFWGIAASWFLDENAELVEWIRSQFPPLDPLDGPVLEMAEEIANLVNQHIEGIDHQKREKISAEAMRQLRKFIIDFQAAKALFDLIGSLVSVEFVMEEKQETICETRQ